MPARARCLYEVTFPMPVRAPLQVCHVSYSDLLGRRFYVLPVPPLQHGWFMFIVVCVIYRAPKYIKNATVNMFSLCLYQFLVQALWIPPLQVAYLLDSDIIQ